MSDDVSVVRLPFVVHLACWLFCISTILGFGTGIILLMDYRFRMAELSRAVERIGATESRETTPHFRLSEEAPLPIRKP